MVCIGNLNDILCDADTTASHINKSCMTSVSYVKFLRCLTLVKVGMLTLDE